MLVLDHSPVVLETVQDVVDYMDAFFGGKVPDFAQQNIARDKIGYLLDHDGTVGSRNPLKNDDTHLNEERYLNVQALAKSSCFTIIPTSRDLEIMREYYHNQHAAVLGIMPTDKFAIAGSGGYMIQQDLSSDAVDFIIPVVDENGVPYDQDIVEKGAEATRWITDQLEERYPGFVRSDRRRYMAAALCETFPNEKIFDKFQNCAAELTRNREEFLEHRIKLKMDPGLKRETLTGYIDFKLKDATKYEAVSWMMNNLETLGYKKPELIVAAGDTEPDEKIVQAARDAGIPVLAVCVDTHIKDHSKGVWNVCCPSVEIFHYVMMYMHSPEKVRALALKESREAATRPDDARTASPAPDTLKR
ncbi:MAG: hypothetical protein PHE27_02390 [Alphaproteobacteria bacterium]|nr:hypothetical protein [Alphaproteobacteria bacterium]